MIWNLIGTIGGKFLDIVVKWNDKRSKWQINLRAFGCVPARPVFERKLIRTHVLACQVFPMRCSMLRPMHQGKQQREQTLVVQLDRWC